MEDSYAPHQETQWLGTNALGARLPFFSQARPVRQYDSLLTLLLLPGDLAQLTTS
jgi:hypothetical protein